MRSASQEYAHQIRDVVQQCYSCWNCESYCPFFPRVFGLLDREQTGEEGLLEAAYPELLSLCYDCKLCKTACPFGYDLPGLVLRARAEEVARDTVPWIQHVFRHVDRMQEVGRWMAPLLNFLGRRWLARWILQKTLGLHRRRELPRFHFLTFRTRAPFLQMGLEGTFRPRRRNFHHPRQVVYFHGCYTDHHRPQEGMAALRLLHAQGIQVVLPRQRCCGLPQLSEGFHKEALENMRYNLKMLQPYLESGYDIVVTSSPCALTLRQEYPEYLGDEAKPLRDHVFEVTEYLWELCKCGVWRPPRRPLPMRVAYHVACHLKAQRIGTPSLELLRRVPGLKVTVVDRGCCGLAGIQGYAVQGFEQSMEIGAGMLEGIREAAPDLALSDCPKCNLQILQGTGIQAVHPLELLAQAYEEDGTEPVEVEEPGKTPLSVRGLGVPGRPVLERHPPCAQGESHPSLP